MPDQELKVFDIILSGYGDGKVLRIASPSQSFVQRYVGMRNFQLHEPINEIEIHPDHPSVDFTVDYTGNPVAESYH